MRVGELAALYALVGGGVAIVWVLRAAPASRRVVDAALLLIAWPLYAPALWAGGAPRGPLPLAVEARLRAAEARADEVERLLARPELDAAAAEVRLAELDAAGHEGAARAVAARIRNIERLRAIRDRYRAELAEIDALADQLRTQMEIVRLTAGQENAARVLLTELVERVDGLDAVLADEVLYPQRPPPVG